MLISSGFSRQAKGSARLRRDRLGAGQTRLAVGASSNACVPFIAAILPEAAATAPKRRKVIDGFDPHDIFGHLVPELALDPKPQRRTVLDRQGPAVHVIGEDGLGMKSVDKVDALVIPTGPVQRLVQRVGAMEYDVAGLRLQPGQTKDSPKGRACPFADPTPTHLAIVTGDLRSRREGPQVRERQGLRLLEKS